MLNSELPHPSPRNIQFTLSFDAYSLYFSSQPDSLTLMSQSLLAFTIRSPMSSTRTPAPALQLGLDSTLLAHPVLPSWSGIASQSAPTSAFALLALWPRNAPLHSVVFEAETTAFAKQLASAVSGSSHSTAKAETLNSDRTNMVNVTKHSQLQIFFIFYYPPSL